MLLFISPFCYSSGTDFEKEIETSLLFLQEEDTLPVPFTVINDDIPEVGETFSISMSISEVVSGFSLPPPSRADICIDDDDSKSNGMLFFFSFFVVAFTFIFYFLDLCKGFLYR